jgi:hypothetical protein
MLLLALIMWANFDPPSHNEHDGYIEACGQLPGLVGDDC